MTISIYRAYFFVTTTLHTVHVPNWFERVVLRRKKKYVSYNGTGRWWSERGNDKPLKKSLQIKLARLEKVLKAEARKRNTRLLVFK